MKDIHGYFLTQSVLLLGVYCFSGVRAAFFVVCYLVVLTPISFYANVNGSYATGSFPASPHGWKHLPFPLLPGCGACMFFLEQIQHPGTQHGTGARGTSPEEATTVDVHPKAKLDEKLK